MDCVIYKIEDNTSDKLYIGSTTQDLKKRLRGHIDKKNCSSYEIIQNGDYIIAEIERCDSENRYYREQFWIDNSDNCINKKKALITPEQRKEQKRKAKLNEDRDKVNKRKKELYHYQNTWGGEKRRENNLLCIDVNYFC